MALPIRAVRDFAEYRATLTVIDLSPRLSEREGRVRLVDHEEALVTFPRIYERFRRARAGLLRRSRDWWELRKLDGEPAGYALYRVVAASEHEGWRNTVRVIEAIGADPRATREIWRFLLQIDWMNELEVRFLPVDHPLLQIVAHVKELHARVVDGLWLRLACVGAALSARSYASDGRVTLRTESEPWCVEGF
jgi:predicted acetyltransferase